MTRPRIAVSAGEPAGIGPDIVLAALAGGVDAGADLVVIGDRSMLESRTALLGLKLSLVDADDAGAAGNGPTVRVLDEPLAAEVVPGEGNPRNAAGVLAALRRAAEGCLAGDFDAMVTAPVNKAVIADSGVPFSGHTEYLAELTHTPRVVMLLAAGTLRVALATTHLPLAAVPGAVTGALLRDTLRILHGDLRRRFAIAAPRISVLGLNPHAGEGGYLGSEDDAIIAPAIRAARDEGIDASGPWPADTAFNPALAGKTDAFLAMYHDQGLPVLKFASFGAAVNITLGLPLIRTSVDHGTAFDIAGTGRADGGSFKAAVDLAVELAKKRGAGAE